MSTLPLKTKNSRQCDARRTSGTMNPQEEPNHAPDSKHACSPGVTTGLLGGGHRIHKKCAVYRLD